MVLYCVSVFLSLVLSLFLSLRVSLSLSLSLTVSFSLRLSTSCYLRLYNHSFSICFLCTIFLNFNAPSLPFQGDQAVNAHATRALPPPYSGGRVWSIVPYVCRRAMTERCLASGGGEAEETGHSEESGGEGEVEWSERGELGVGVGWGKRRGGGLDGSAGLLMCNVNIAFIVFIKDNPPSV